jgi:2-oxo-4-hydroxy-4-carboxy--5-ureidoimidazoline (OHCU) decarboxylase
MALDVARIDRLPEPEFVAAAAPWFEGAPRFLARLARARPFGDESTLVARAREIASTMPQDEQIELIDAHPRLGAPPATVSSDSFREQGYDSDPSDAIADLDRLNRAYEDRFGFRFCVFVNGRPRRDLVPILENALHADRADEIRRAIGDVVTIAEDRLRKAGERVEATR